MLLSTKYHWYLGPLKYILAFDHFKNVKGLQILCQLRIGTQNAMAFLFWIISVAFIIVWLLNTVAVMASICVALSSWPKVGWIQIADQRAWGNMLLSVVVNKKKKVMVMLLNLSGAHVLVYLNSWGTLQDPVKDEYFVMLLVVCSKLWLNVYVWAYLCI